jgi:hypothetical protein
MFCIVTEFLLALDGNFDQGSCLSHVGTEGCRNRRLPALVRSSRRASTRCRFVYTAFEADANTWARAIERVLADPIAAFRRAQGLRQALEAILSWDHAVAAILAGFGL